MSTIRRMISRRALLGLAARVLAVVPGIGLLARSAAAATGGAAGDPAANGSGALAGMIRDLFPHRGLTDDFYADCAGKVTARAGAIADGAQQLRDGLARLDELCGRAGWAGADAAARVAAMRKLESEPFFQFVRSASLELIYRDPRVWNLIGYGGNALKKGGYLYRGFNDINWLPRTGKQ